MTIKAFNINLHVRASKVAGNIPYIMMALSFIVIALFAKPAKAIVMQIQIIGQADSSCYTYVSNIAAEHRDTNGFCALWILYAGTGLFPLIPSMFMEFTHTGDWGRRLDRAKKLKHLIVVATGQSAYVNGDNPLIISKKNPSRKKTYYLSKQKEWDIFLGKLIQESGLSDLSDSSADEVAERHLRNIILRANKTGMLCTKDLMDKMVKENSFAPLRKIILDGQLEDRVLRMENILTQAKKGENAIIEREKAEIERQEEELRNYLGLEALEAVETDAQPQKTLQAQRPHPFLKRLYARLQKMIDAIPPFQF